MLIHHLANCRQQLGCQLRIGVGTNLFKCNNFSVNKNAAINVRTIFLKNTNHIKRIQKLLVPTHRIWCSRLSNTFAKTENGIFKKATKKVPVTRTDIYRLIGLAKSEKLVLTGAIICLIVSSVITMCVPYALGKMLDIIFNKDGTSVEGSTGKLKVFSMVLFLVFVIGGLANFGRVYLFNSASLRIVRDLRSALYRRMLYQEIAWFDTKGTGELVNRLATDSYAVGHSLSQNLSDGLRSLVMIVAGTTMMIYTSPTLALVSTCVVPCVAGAAVIYGRYVRAITIQLLDKLAELSKSAEERLANVKAVKSFSKEDFECKTYDSLLSEVLTVGYKEVIARSIFFGGSGFAGNVIIVSVLYYGGILVVNEQLTIGALTSFILYATYSAIAINGLSNFYTELNKGVGSAQRIWEIFDRKFEIPLNVGMKPTTKPRGEVKLKNIKFFYPSRPSVSILNDFNLTLLPGQTTAIVGRSGSGKTTVAALLLRLYDPAVGQVLLDDYNIKQLDPLWLRSHIAAVNQEPTLFSGTIRDNILYGLNTDATITEEQFNEVVRKAHVDEFISQLPCGLETIVGQRGVMLSGGQKQRVAIARAIIKNPTILILDEATSALDSVSEELVQNALEQLGKGRTVLTIAHRLSTIRNADKIAVVDNGRVAEMGRYDELISTNGSAFKELVRKQAFLMDS